MDYFVISGTPQNGWHAMTIAKGMPIGLSGNKTNMAEARQVLEMLHPDANPLRSAKGSPVTLPAREYQIEIT